MELVHFCASAWAGDTDGKSFSLASYQGKPVVVIFYLGYGCLHCAEQLQKFAPEAQKYAEYAAVEAAAARAAWNPLKRKTAAEKAADAAVAVSSPDSSSESS